MKLPRAWDTASASMTVCARALGDVRDVFAIAAASGLAFRTCSDEEVTLGAPHAYPWREELVLAAARAGYVARIESSSPSDPQGSAPHAAARVRAGTLIGDASRPTVLWGAQAPEFGIVAGRDGDQLRVSGILGEEAMHADDIGKGDVPVVFAMQLVEKIEIPEDEAALATLRAAVHHAGGVAVPTLTGYRVGLDAWRAVTRALESGRVDPAGLAYLVQRYAEGRTAASSWLDTIPFAEDLKEARAAFKRSAGMLRELAKLHPFPPAPGDMLDSTRREQAHDLIDETLRAETQGILAIEKLIANPPHRGKT